MSPQPRNEPELATLLALFYDAPEQLGKFVETTANEMPSVPRQLLAHNHHMTVTVEAHHGSLVDVQVLAAKRDEPYYARKILLARQSDGQIVQFGIVRIDFNSLDEEVRREIEAQRTPLGRILIEHKVLREVELFDLYRIEPGPELCQLFSIVPADTTYGRTALIHCNGQPAIELLEIVTPE